MEPLLAIDSLRRVRGGSQAHVILADNNRQYVCKMKKNPQSDLVLVNELLATRLARHIGLCVPTPELILATDTFFDHNPSVKFELGSRSYQPGTGLQFGSELIVGYKTYDYVPSEYPRHRMASLRDFHGILAFDKWTCQVDGRQLLFNQSRRGAKLKFVFMDFGYAFHQDWEFHDRPFGGVYPQNYVYEGVSGWDSFEPWLSAIEGISPAVLSSIADDVPEEWLTDRSRDDLNRLCETLYQRRHLVRQLLTNFRGSSRSPFPNWASSFAISDSSRSTTCELTAA
jgi:hypothetical protein